MILAMYLLNTSAEGFAHADRLWDLIEVPVTSNEEVKGQGKLCEGAARHAFNERLIIDFEKAASTGPREPDYVPVV